MNRLWLLALIALCGCRFSGVPAPEPWEERVAKSEVLTRAQEAPPLGYRLAVLPIQVQYDPRTLYLDDDSRNGSVPDLSNFRQELVEGLDALSLFRRVEARGEQGDGAEALSLATWDARDDLVLECELRTYYQKYLGHTAYLTWFLVYATYVFPAWNVPVDSYGGGLELHVRVRSVQAGTKPLLETTYVVKPKQVAQEFTPNDRELVGFLDLSALWNVESSLEDSNWRAIERGVGPHARREVLARLAHDLESQVASTLRGSEAVREPLVARLRKRFALVVGISEYADPAVGSIPFARQDANSVLEFFESSRGGGLARGRDLLVLENEQATREAILGALDVIEERASPTDEVVLYFSGFGTRLPRPVPSPGSSEGALGGLAGLRPELGARGIFLPQDARADDVASTGLGLDLLGQRLERFATQRVVLFLDASFNGQGPRTFHVAGPVEATPLGLAHDLRLRDGRLGLLAAQDVAHDLSDAESGLFTQVMTVGMAGGADADDDGRVSVSELSSYANEHVSSRAGLEGVQQSPLIIGAPRGAPLTWPR